MLNAIEHPTAYKWNMRLKQNHAVILHGNNNYDYELLTEILDWIEENIDCSWCWRYCDEYCDDGFNNLEVSFENISTASLFRLRF